MAAGTVRSAGGDAGQVGPSPAPSSPARASPTASPGASTAPSPPPPSRRASGRASVLGLLSLPHPLHSATWSKLAATVRIEELVFIASIERASRRMFPISANHLVDPRRQVVPGHRRSSTASGSRSSKKSTQEPSLDPVHPPWVRVLRRRQLLEISQQHAGAVRLVEAEHQVPGAVTAPPPVLSALSRDPLRAGPRMILGPRSRRADRSGSA